MSLQRRLHCVVRARLLPLRAFATAATASDSPPVTATNRAQATLKRFWKDVDIEDRSDGLVVTLDKRPLKTPSGQVLLIPHNKRLLASLIAHEWNIQDRALQSHALPLTSLTSRAVDGFREDRMRAEIHNTLLKFLDTDSICFHADEPDALVALQEAHWSPLLDWARDTFAVNIKTSKSFFSSPQSEETKEVMRKVIEGLSDFELAAMERITTVTKSLIIATALVRGRLNVEEAAQAAHAEVNSQIQRWGEVEDSHDVDYHDIRRQLSSTMCLLSNI